MGLSIISWAGAFRALRRAVRACLRPRAVRGAPAVHLHTGMHTAAGRGHVAWPAPGARRSGRPLRVLRVVDAGHAPSTAGRMVICGRMADVCAELDRLAALEAAAA